jgi:hypothetical protein
VKRSEKRNACQRGPKGSRQKRKEWMGVNYIDAFTIDEIRNPARARFDGASSERLEIGGAIALDEVADRAPGEIRPAQAAHLDTTLHESLHKGVKMGFESAP